MNVNNLLLRVNDAAAEGGFYADLASAPADIIRPVQTHSCNIGVIGEDGGISDFADTDALICFRRGMAIGVKTADCVPVLVFAPDIRAVAAIHAGWKGSLGGIVSRTMEMLADAGADMELIKAAMGLCISGRNYEVSQELAETFATAGFSDCILGGNHLDLPAVNRKRLLSAGVREGNITMPPCCTFESKIYPSWRRTPGTQQRLLSWIKAL